MSGGTTTTQQQQQQSQSAPWQPSQAPLQTILSKLNSPLGNTDPNGVEQGALGTLANNANNTPNLVPQATGLMNSLSSGGIDRTGLLSNAYSSLQGRLSPYADGANLDPTKSPGMQSVLDTIRNDVSNNVNGQFAAAGRDMSGINQQALGRGIAQGEAQPLLNQYNQNVQNQFGAANSLFGAGGSTAAGLSGLDQQALANRGAGLDVGSAIPGYQNMGANAQLAAQAAARNLPLGNMQNISQLLLPIAGLGSQSSGSSSGTMTQQQPLLPTILGGLLGGASIASKFYKPGVGF